MKPYPNIKKGLVTGSVTGLVITIIVALGPLDSGEGPPPPVWRTLLGHFYIFLIVFVIVGVLAALRPERKEKD